MLTTRYKQSGMGLLGMLIIAMMAGFFVMAGIKIMPGYFEYQAIKQLTISAVEEYDEDEDTLSDIRRAITADLNTNQVKRLSPRDVVIERRDGDVIVDSSFEDRIPLVWRIDAVVKYDDLLFIAGENYSN